MWMKIVSMLAKAMLDVLTVEVDVGLFGAAPDNVTFVAIPNQEGSLCDPRP